MCHSAAFGQIFVRDVGETGSTAQLSCLGNSRVSITVMKSSGGICQPLKCLWQKGWPASLPAASLPAWGKPLGCNSRDLHALKQDPRCCYQTKVPSLAQGLFQSCLVALREQQLNRAGVQDSKQQARRGTTLQGRPAISTVPTHRGSDSQAAQPKPHLSPKSCELGGPQAQRLTTTRTGKRRLAG